VDSGARDNLAGLTVHGGNASNGCGIHNGGTLTVSKCTISGNSADDGEGAGMYNSGTLSVINSTLSDNSAGSSAGSGGGIYNSATLTVTNATVAGNIALAGGGFANSGTLTVTNATVAGNSATVGGGILNLATGTLTAIDTTISGNIAYVGGGIENATAGTLALSNTIVAGNSVSAGGMNPDVSGTVAATSAFNLVGIGTGLSGISNGANHNQIGTASKPINPRLAPLDNYGGPAQTMALLSGSPAIGKGEIVNAITTDQRGEASATPPGIGAYQTQTVASFAVSVPSTVAAGSSFSVTVTAQDAAGNTVTGYGGTATITSSDGQKVFLMPATVQLINGTATVTATLDIATTVTLTAKAGSLTGTSTNITVNPAAPASFVVSAPSTATAGIGFPVTITAKDRFNNLCTNYSGAATLASSDGQTVIYTLTTQLVWAHGTTSATVKVDKAAAVTLTASAGMAKGSSGNITVTNQITVTTNSDAAGHSGMSLRDAVDLANTAAGWAASDTILFNPQMMGSTTITIDGGGKITINGNAASRVFLVDRGVHAVLMGLTIANGKVIFGNGGGIYNQGFLMISNATLSGNNATYQAGTWTGNGAAIYNFSTIFNVATLTISNTTLTGNSCNGNGGIYTDGTLTVNKTTFSSNTAWYGGAIENDGLASVSNSTFSDNSSGSRSYSGGAIINDGPMTLTNDKVTGNSAAGEGGGIDSVSGTLVMQNTTVTGNKAATGPDIYGPVAAGSANNVIGDGSGMTGLVNGDANHNTVEANGQSLYNWTGSIWIQEIHYAYGVGGPWMNIKLITVHGALLADDASDAVSSSLTSADLLLLIQTEVVRDDFTYQAQQNGQTIDNVAFGWQDNFSLTVTGPSGYHSTQSVPLAAVPLSTMDAWTTGPGAQTYSWTVTAGTYESVVGVTVPLAPVSLSGTVTAPTADEAWLLALSAANQPLLTALSSTLYDPYFTLVLTGPGGYHLSEMIYFSSISGL
jgi:hypothetical protein